MAAMVMSACCDVWRSHMSSSDMVVRRSEFMTSVWCPGRCGMSDAAPMVPSGCGSRMHFTPRFSWLKCCSICSAR